MGLGCRHQARAERECRRAEATLGQVTEWEEGGCVVWDDGHMQHTWTWKGTCPWSRMAEMREQRKAGGDGASRFSLCSPSPVRPPQFCDS